MIDDLELSDDSSILSSPIMKDDIEKLREDTISEIKEKVRKNPKFLHPCNKDRLEYQKILKFENGYDFTVWMQQNGIMRNPSDVLREFKHKRACDLGYINIAEREREWYNNNDNIIHISGCEDSNWSTFFGNRAEDLFEEFLETIFMCVEHMRYGNVGFDFICRNPRKEFVCRYPQFKLGEDKEYKIQIKVKCLRDNGKGSIQWNFSIGYNKIPDYFILCGFDNRERLNPLYILVFHKDDIIRDEKFWRRDSFTVANRANCLLPFRSHELTSELGILTKIWNRLKDNIV